MQEFLFPSLGRNPVGIADLYRTFNHYRIWKYMIAMLLMLDKKELSRYWILEPGCGDGSKLRFLTEMRARPHRCVGFDISSQAIEGCRDISPGAMNFQIASATDIPFKDASFDLVVCSALLNCFKEDGEIKSISREVRRVIKHKGVFFVVDITEDFPKIYPPDFSKRFRWFDTQKNELEVLLSDEFKPAGRHKVFSCELYYASKHQYVEPVALPQVEMGIDQGTCPGAYCLYAFQPKGYGQVQRRGT
jgi:ubiquinone/menaquinone biosynthesis C-methylase UbiE